MKADINILAQRFLHKGLESLSQREKLVIKSIANRVHISRNIQKDFEARYSFGQRLADKVASFGGSWAFIILVSIHAEGTNGEQLKWGTVGNQDIARLTIGFYNPYKDLPFRYLSSACDEMEAARRNRIPECCARSA